MIDASIGGKTALNMDSIKNQIGTFYQPSKVFIDLSIIKTMSSQIIQDGLGEMFKYAILSKEGLLSSFKNYLDNQQEDLLHDMIKICCAMKLKIVQIDEKDQSIRKTLNLGHTFGHAIETESNNSISHGISVINGILMASFLSFRKGYLKKEEFHKIEEIGDSLLPNRYKINDVDKYVGIMLKDKKNQNQKIGVIAIKDIGDVILQHFTFNQIYEVAKEYNEHISN
jgi:3-dehydroquinate synthase